MARRCLPARWLAVDAWYGNSPAFRDGVAALALWSMTAISTDTLVWRCQPATVLLPYRGKGRKPTRCQLKTASYQPCRVDHLLKRLPKTVWMRTTITEGRQGPIMADVAVVWVTEARDGLPGPRLWLLIRRSLRDPNDGRYYLSNAPEERPTAELVRMLGVRWTVELAFAQGKQEVGMDAYEVRSWQGWHQHQMIKFPYVSPIMDCSYACS